MFKKLLIYSLLLPMMAFAGQLPDAAKIEEATHFFMKKHDAQPVDAGIKAIAQKALDECKIDGQVTILQRNNGDNSYATVYQNLYKNRFLIVGIKNKHPDEITFDIYHECGHLHYNDAKTDRERFKKFIAFSVGTTALTTCSTIFAALKVKGSVFKKCAIGAAGITAGIASFLGGLSVYRTTNQAKEMRADSFACEKLLKSGQIDAILGDVSNNIEEFKFNRVLITKATPFDTHPCAYERAANAIEILRKNNIDPADPEQVKKLHTDEGLINNLPSLVAHYFGKK